MHRLGDVVDVRLVEALPIAGALRFELLSEGQSIPRDRKNDRPARGPKSFRGGKEHPGRSPHKGKRKPDKKKSGKVKRGKSKSWKR